MSRLWRGPSSRFTRRCQKGPAQAKSYGAVTGEKVVEVGGSAFLDFTLDKEEKILTFDVKTPICRGGRQTRAKL